MKNIYQSIDITPILFWISLKFHNDLHLKELTIVHQSFARSDHSNVKKIYTDTVEQTTI